MILKDNAAYFKTIGTLHHNFLLFFARSEIFYRMELVKGPGFDVQATKCIQQRNMTEVSKNYCMANFSTGAA